MIDSDRIIINVAITGMLPTKAETPHVPISTDDVVACVKRVRDAGASIVHLHARDSSHAPTSEGAAYQHLVAKVRESCPDILVCVSLSGRLTDEARRIIGIPEREQASIPRQTMPARS